VRLSEVSLEFIPIQLVAEELLTHLSQVMCGRSCKRPDAAGSQACYFRIELPEHASHEGREQTIGCFALGGAQAEIEFTRVRSTRRNGCFAKRAQLLGHGDASVEHIAALMEVLDLGHIVSSGRSAARRVVTASRNSQS
jgi:hypothetical protein